MRARVSVATLALLALAACSPGDDEDGDRPDGSPSSSETSSAGATGTAPSAVDPTGGSATPATGRLVDTEVMSYRLPDGVEWFVERNGRAASWYDAEADDDWRIFQFEHLGSAATGPEDLDGVARASLRTARSRYPDVRRLPDRSVGGVEGWVLEHDGPDQFGDAEFFYEFGALVNDDAGWMTLAFSFPADTPETRNVIESVLASVEWR